MVGITVSRTLSTNHFYHGLSRQILRTRTKWSEEAINISRYMSIKVRRTLSVLASVWRMIMGTVSTSKEFIM